MMLVEDAYPDLAQAMVALANASTDTMDYAVAAVRQELDRAVGPVTSTPPPALGAPWGARLNPGGGRDA